MKNPHPPEVSWPEAQQGMLRIALATLAFTVWHSLLCSDQAKGLGRTLFGTRRGTAYYRAFFMGQSAVTTGALVLFLLRQPHRTLYRAQGWKKWLGWAGQFSALLIGAAALSKMDKAKFAGIKGPRLLKEDNEVVEAQAQGPEVEDDGRIHDVGIFRCTRHPMEWAPVLLLLSSPVMKTNWLTFNLLAAVYSYVGALHEEKRLLRQSGAAYAKYQKEVPFLVGWPRSRK